MRPTLPELKYGYKDLEPHISEEQLKIHHQKHHQAYVNSANTIIEKLEQARKEGKDVDMKATLKDLSWNLAGHILHSLFWDNLAPPGRGGELSGKLKDSIIKEYGSFERFKKEFTQAAASVEGSGWAALAMAPDGSLVIMQIEKHNTNVIPNHNILLVFDVFEHAYYIDYKNDRGKFIESLWALVDWTQTLQRAT